MRVAAVLLFGIFLGAFGYWFFAGQEPTRPGSAISPESRVATSPETAESPRAMDRGGARALAGRTTAARPPDGMLGVGDGLVLATGEIVSGADVVRADLVVEDIHGWSAWVRTVHGGAPAALPLGGISVPRGAPKLAARYDSAPPTLSAERLQMNPTEPSGVGFALGGDAQPHLIWVEQLRSRAPLVLERGVRFGRRPVPSKEGGGIADIPTALESDDPPVTTEDLQRIRVMGASVPQMMNGTIKGARRPFRVFENMGAEIRVSDSESTFVLPKPLSDDLLVGGSSMVVAAAGDAEGAQSEVEFHGVLVLVGDLRGDHRLDAHAHAHVTGDLVGTVKMGVHASLVVEGDLRGTVAMNAHCKVVVLGELRGTIAYPEGANPSHAALFLDTHVDKRDMAALPRGGTWPQLYVRSSDLEEGTHVGTAGFGAVFVGGDFWERLSR